MSNSLPPDDGAPQETHHSSAREEAARPQPIARLFTVHWLEVVEAVLMGVVAVATAWGGYQAARWSGLQSVEYVEASGIRVEATQASTHAGQLTLYDLVLFSQWLNAQVSGQTQLAHMYQRRFRPEFQPVFQAWLATDPFHNANAPPGPLFMPQYKLTEADRANQLEIEASKAFAAGRAANEQSEAYVLNSVFLASTLFFVGIGQRFNWMFVRIAILVGALGKLVYGVYHLLIYPVI
jgi:hypothetical protein